MTIRIDDFSSVIQIYRNGVDVEKAFEHYRTTGLEAWQDGSLNLIKDDQRVKNRELSKTSSSNIYDQTSED